MTGRLTYLDANGGDGAWTDTPKIRQLYLQWCHDSGLTPWVTEAS